jgi:mannose-6-phosphate isomerase-like protein (cupin superfamily)
MNLLPGEEIGMEVHPSTTQFIRIERGNGKAIVGDSTYSITDGDAVVVPMGTRHNIINIGEENLQLYTVYCGVPAHPAATYEFEKED